MLIPQAYAQAAGQAPQGGGLFLPLMMVGILPAFGITGELQLSWVGAAAVGALGYWVLNNAILLLKDADDKRARKLMLSSIAYLTGMQIIYIIDRFI